MKYFCPTLFVALILLFLGCEEPMNEPVLEDGSTQEPASLPTTTFFTETVSIDEIPEIADFINARAGKDMITGKADDEKAVFDIEHIARVIDTLNNTLYSFGFTLPDAPKTVIHNLVVGVDSLGVQYVPIILKYSSDEATYDSWAESGFDFGHFTGTVQQHAFSSYFDEGLFSKNDCEAQFDAVGDPIPCNEDDFSDGSAGGGAASGGIGSGSGSSGGCTYDNTFVPCGGSNQYTLHGSDSCGGNGDGSYWVLDVSCPNGGSTHILKGANDACDDCGSGPSGGAAINIDLAMAARISLLVDTLDLDIGLTQEQISFLNLPENWGLTENIVSFWRNIDNDIQMEGYIKNLVNASIVNAQLSMFPFVKYPESKSEEYKTRYPRLTEFLMEELPKVAENEDIVNVIHGLTEAPIETIKEALQWGKGPEIEITQLGGDGDNELYGVYNGHVIPENINTLFLDIDLVNDFENVEKDQNFTDAMAFLIAVTILHEYTHLGDTVFGNEFWGELHAESRADEDEVGLVFEKEIFGESVWRSNVGLVMLKNKLF
ncbi:hypothetical protein ABV409_01155 [Flagellimonas sp. DF-77]|uniref:hypothetical protein n=1 Tax=Flagellimonas algarum TaxID=3230298 RepID=UPI0033937491